MRKGGRVPEVTLRRATESERPLFAEHFQDYLAELSRLSGARPDRNGVFRYDMYDLYWHDERRMPFFVECDGQTVGLLLLRELPEHESPTGGLSLQVAELYVFKPYRRRAIAQQTMRIVAQMARERERPLTWSAYINNGPANALYRSVLSEFDAKDGAWVTERSRGVDRSGLARFYYQMVPSAAARETKNA